MGRAGVYVIRNIATEMVYIGSSCVDVDVRLGGQMKSLARGKNPSTLMQTEYNSFGGQFFVASVLIYCEKYMARFYEDRAIKRIGSHNRHIGFNIRGSADDSDARFGSLEQIKREIRSTEINGDRCCAWLPSGCRYVRCNGKPKHESNGRFYCGYHNPAKHKKTSKWKLWYVPWLAREHGHKFAHKHKISLVDDQ